MIIGGLHTMTQGNAIRIVAWGKVDRMEHRERLEVFPGRGRTVPSVQQLSESHHRTHLAFQTSFHIGHAKVPSLLSLCPLPQGPELVPHRLTACVAGGSARRYCVSYLRYSMCTRLRSQGCVLECNPHA